jgi:hypothetical protein
VMAVGGGNVPVTVQAQDADGQASQGCHHAGCVSCSDQGFVLLVSNVADPVGLCSRCASGRGPGQPGSPALALRSLVIR